MKKLLLLPTVFFPYAFLLGVFAGKLFSEDVAPYIFGSLVGLIFLSAPICNIIFMILSRSSEPFDLIRTALLVKIVHIPMYIVVFLFGVGASVMFFMTFPLILLSILLDYITLFMSSMVSVYALAKNIKNNKAPSIIALICQFFFCTDVIALFVVDRIEKKRRSTPSVPLAYKRDVEATNDNGTHSSSL